MPASTRASAAFVLLTVPKPRNKGWSNWMATSPDVALLMASESTTGPFGVKTGTPSLDVRVRFTSADTPIVGRQPDNACGTSSSVARWPARAELSVGLVT